MAPLLLGSATRSVLTSSERNFETVRLAIATDDRSNEAMHSSQVAVGSLMRAIPGTSKRASLEIVGAGEGCWSPLLAERAP